MPKGALFYQPLIDFLITSGPPAAPRIMFCSDCKQYQALRDPSPHDQPLIDFLITRTSPPHRGSCSQTKRQNKPHPSHLMTLHQSDDPALPFIPDIHSLILKYDKSMDLLACETSRKLSYLLKIELVPIFIVKMFKQNWQTMISF